jgi:uncharacterized protein with PQ loop repeat
MKVRYAVILTMIYLIACLISAIAILGHILHITRLHTWGDNTPAMAINTAICIFCLSIGAILHVAWQINK